MSLTARTLALPRCRAIMRGKNATPSPAPTNCTMKLIWVLRAAMCGSKPAAWQASSTMRCRLKPSPNSTKGVSRKALSVTLPWRASGCSAGSSATSGSRRTSCQSKSAGAGSKVAASSTLPERRRASSASLPCSSSSCTSMPG